MRSRSAELDHTLCTTSLTSFIFSSDLLNCLFGSGGSSSALQGLRYWFLHGSLYTLLHWVFSFLFQSSSAFIAQKLLKEVKGVGDESSCSACSFLVMLSVLLSLVRTPELLPQYICQLGFSACLHWCCKDLGSCLISWILTSLWFLVWGNSDWPLVSSPGSNWMVH